MSKTSWNEELAMIVFCQFYCYMLAISRRVLADIHCYIEHSAFYAAYQLTLGIWWALEVQASHYAIAAHRLVVLAEVNTMPQDWGYFLFKLSLAEALEEVTTSITEEVWLYNENALYICFYYIHCCSYILNSFLMFVLSLQVLKKGTCHNHSSTPFNNQKASFHCTHLSKKFHTFSRHGKVQASLLCS